MQIFSTIGKMLLLSIIFIHCQSSRIKNTSDIHATTIRNRIKINDDWRFMRYNGEPDKLMYDIRPEVSDRNDNKVADSKPTDAVEVKASQEVLKNWILPSGNDFIKDPITRHIRPAGDPGNDFPFVQNNFKDENWENVTLPHDWAINQPFYKGNNPEVGGGMGRLPSHGVAWYRKKLDISAAEKGKTIYLDIDGAMSYSIVWLNGHLVGGWPYGYNSYRLDLTPYLNFESENQLAIRIDNPNYSARWYPGGGIYRNVWLTKVAPVHVSHWGTFITTPSVSATNATVKLALQVENRGSQKQKIEARTDIYALDDKGSRINTSKTAFPISVIALNAGENKTTESILNIANPRLWGVYPQQKPHLYVAHTQLFADGKPIDDYETQFGIRDIQFDPIKGLIVNGEAIKLKGVNQHHDLGALGAAFNVRAAERHWKCCVNWAAMPFGCLTIRLHLNCYT